MMAPVELGEVSAGGRTRVLVVEDDPKLVVMLADLLREEGYEVETALAARPGQVFNREQLRTLVFVEADNAAGGGHLHALPAAQARPGGRGHRPRPRLPGRRGTPAANGRASVVA